MADQRIALPWCDEEIVVELPENWHVMGVLEPKALPAAGDPAATQKNLPFVDFVAGPEAGLARARRRFPDRAEVVVLPHGGITYPILG